MVYFYKNIKNISAIDSYIISRKNESRFKKLGPSQNYAMFSYFLFYYSIKVDGGKF